MEKECWWERNKRSYVDWAIQFRFRRSVWTFSLSHAVGLAPANAFKIQELSPSCHWSTGSSTASSPEYDLVLPLQTYTVFFLPCHHLAAVHCSYLPFRTQFLHNTCPIQLLFFHCLLCWIVPSSLSLCNTSFFPQDRSNLSSGSLTIKFLQHNVTKLST
jgi:hypothetical protein